jgi:hypothetical protein
MVDRVVLGQIFFQYFCFPLLVRFNQLSIFIYSCTFSLWHKSPQLARTAPFTRFLDHTQRHKTIGRTPLDEWSARRRNPYLTTQHTDIHALIWIRTYNLSRRAATDLRLRPRGHWDRHSHTTYCHILPTVTYYLHSYTTYSHILPTATYYLQSPPTFTYYLQSHTTYSHILPTVTYYLHSHTTYIHILPTVTYYLQSHTTYIHILPTDT